MIESAMLYLTLLVFGVAMFYGMVPMMWLIYVLFGTRINLEVVACNAVIHGDQKLKGPLRMFRVYLALDGHGVLSSLEVARIARNSPCDELLLPKPVTVYCFLPWVRRLGLHSGTSFVTPASFRDSLSFYLAILIAGGVPFISIAYNLMTDDNMIFRLVQVALEGV